MRALKMTRRMLVCAAAMLLMPAAVRAGDVKDVLKLVPDDAWGFVIAKSLNNIDEKALQLKDLLGLPIEGPVSEMALGMLQLGDVIDKGSPIGAVMLDFQKFGGQNGGALIVPAKDPKALLEKLSAEEAQEGISKCTIMGEPAFAATKGKFVIVSPNEDCATRIAKSKKSAADGMAESRLAVIGKSDVFISVALHSIVTAYKEMIMMPLQMMSASGGVNPKDIEKLVKMFEELEALDFSFSLDKGGLAFTMMMCPKESSDLQGLIGDWKNSSDPLLAMLPREKFLFTMGALGTSSEHSAKFGSEHPISGYLKMGREGEALDQKALDTLDAEVLKMQKSIKRYATSVCVLPSGGDGLIGFAGVTETGSAKGFIESSRKLYKAAFEVSDDEDLEAVKKCIVHTPDAEMAGGNNVDTIKIDFAAFPDAEKDVVKKLEKLFGKELVIRFGAVDDARVAITIGGGAKRFAAVCSASKSGEKLPADLGITETSSHLPSPRGSEGFVAVDTILMFAKDVMKAMGEKDEFPIEIPTLNAPVAFSGCVQEKIGRVDVMIPMKLIKAGKEAYDKYAATAKDEDFDEDEDAASDEKPAKKSDAKASAKKKPKAEDADEDSDDDALAKPKAKAAPKKPEKKDDDGDE